MVTMNRNKVVIVGTGQVGATAAFGIVTHGLCNELVLIDRSAAKALGEARDLDDGSEFQDRHVKVRAGDYDDCKDADIVVITVGPQAAGQLQPHGRTQLHRGSCGRSGRQRHGLRF